MKLKKRDVVIGYIEDPDLSIKFIGEVLKIKGDKVLLGNVMVFHSMSNIKFNMENYNWIDFEGKVLIIGLPEITGNSLLTKFTISKGGRKNAYEYLEKEFHIVGFKHHIPTIVTDTGEIDAHADIEDFETHYVNPKKINFDYKKYDDFDFDSYNEDGVQLPIYTL